MCMPRKKVCIVFDLDGTVIDSFHRVKDCLREDGSFDLVEYIQNACTHTKIMSDTLLPLAESMLEFIKRGEFVAICTARTMFKSDYVFLRKHGLKVPHIMSRDKVKSIDHYKMGDGEYKSLWFDWFKKKHGVDQFLMFDDNQAVIERLSQRADTHVFNALEINNI